MEVSKWKLFIKAQAHVDNPLNSQNVHTCTHRCIHGAFFNTDNGAIFSMKLGDAPSIVPAPTWLSTN